MILARFYITEQGGSEGMCDAQKKRYLENARATDEAKRIIIAALQDLKNQTGTVVDTIAVKHRGGKVDRVELKPNGTK